MRKYSTAFFLSVNLVVTRHVGGPFLFIDGYCCGLKDIYFYFKINHKEISFVFLFNLQEYDNL